MTLMKCWSRWYLGLGVTVGLIACAPRIAQADGIPLPPSGIYYSEEIDIGMSSQQAVLVYDAETGREDLVISVQLLGESPEAAWVVPVPSSPEVNMASAEWFSQLSDRTKPRIVTRFVAPPAPFMNIVSNLGAPEGEELPREEEVEVLSRQQVGVYDVSILAAHRRGALLDWLNEHGYTFPTEGEPILDQYVEEGWTFVATRVRPGETARLEGDVQPLWFSFHTERPVYPMRLTALTGSSIDVLIYVLADHQMEITSPGFEIEFAGSLKLRPMASERGELEHILARPRYYVTKLRSPHFAAWAATDDLYFQRAPVDQPYRKVVYRTIVSPMAPYYSPCCLILAPLLLLLALFMMDQYYMRWIKSGRRSKR